MKRSELKSYLPCASDISYESFFVYFHNAELITSFQGIIYYAPPQTYYAKIYSELLWQNKSWTHPMQLGSYHKYLFFIVPNVLFSKRILFRDSRLMLLVDWIKTIITFILFTIMIVSTLINFCCNSVPKWKLFSTALPLSDNWLQQY